MTQPSRITRVRIVEQLKLAARRGDRTALMRAADQMKTLAYSPRYWERYLQLLQNPLARLVDLLLIKQGDKIAKQKGWVTPRRARPRQPARAKRDPRPGRGHRPIVPAGQQSLFPDLP